MGIKDRQKMIRTSNIIRIYDERASEGTKTGKKLHTFGLRPETSGEELISTWNSYVTKYDLSKIPGNFHILPINRLVNFEDHSLYLKNEKLYLPQTRYEFPVSSLLSCDQKNSLGLLLVFYKTPENIEEFPAMCGKFRFFYAQREGDLEYMIVDPRENINKRFRGTSGLRNYRPVISIEDALSRKLKKRIFVNKNSEKNKRLAD